ncbi:MAG: FAD-binding oxidoreductase [Defluviimonas sp.]|uniref:NAD(P)/FAD-dependent oxidoreductase n=1 Tax=Albidovulum sp. TaxID=1872424 RepID=UPI001D48174D|nr:FAD-binding oxidoreductase [Paracoccaceae bacterium]MCC0064851.1 FAD-binding oxidoreductase [Defluviimonas sp.]
MKRIYDAFAYGDGPVAGCYWDTTIARPAAEPAPAGETRVEVAIIGAGFTGLSAALHLARDAGAEVAVLDARRIGWGASGRNGGFASLGGAKASDAQLLRRYGAAALADWHRAQMASADCVAGLVDRYGLEVDAHSHEGETCVAHRPAELAAFRAEAPDLDRFYGVKTRVLTGAEMAAEGMAGPEVHGGLKLPVGFALNPLKYVLGLAAAARAAGARIWEQAPVTAIAQADGAHVLTHPGGRIVARKLILATNGYSSDDLPPWMAGRYLPALSAILVTRPLTAEEIAAQGWSSTGMAYDSRKLLHYFRLMPNGRFLFGGRGGTRADAGALAERQRILRADFERMFPAWAGVETPHFWSGFVCLTRDLVPYVGPLGDLGNAWAGFAWHGNGVLMGSYAGALLAGLATGRGGVPRIMAGPARGFPLAPARRLVLPAAYAWYHWRDRG